MYEAKQCKEKVSRRIDGNGGTKQKVKIDNGRESMLQKSIFAIQRNIHSFTPVIQKSYYKVFEYTQMATGRYVPKVQKNTTYTTLGVRKEEVESSDDGYIKSPKENPQGMSLLSNIQAAQNSVRNPNNLGLFELKDNLYPNMLSILQDPQNRVHYLWGPKNKLPYNQLDGQIKNSFNSWDIITEYNNGWNPVVNGRYKRKMNKNRRKMLRRRRHSR